LLLAIVLTLAASAAAPSPPPEDTLALERRVFVASEIYASVLGHFGHWRGVPNLDLDEAYQKYPRSIIAHNGRRAFELASMEFLARLHNGHSGFDDRWLREHFGQRLGFYAYPIDGRWTVTSTRLAGLRVGDVIRAIDDKDFEAFYRENARYLPASDERWARRSFLEHTYLLPLDFMLTLIDGRTIHVHRSGEFQWPGAEYEGIEVRRDAGIAYIRIPSSRPRRSKAPPSRR
jgi:carboxyl-terminal processing protease